MVAVWAGVVPLALSVSLLKQACISMWSVPVVQHLGCKDSGRETAEDYTATSKKY